MYSSLMPHALAQRWIVALMYSGPLSHRMTLDLPRQAVIWYRARITRSADKEKSISMPSASLGRIPPVEFRVKQLPNLSF